jgi:hypothetical protein
MVETADLRRTSKSSSRVFRIVCGRKIHLRTYNINKASLGKESQIKLFLALDCRDYLI